MVGHTQSQHNIRNITYNSNSMSTISSIPSTVLIILTFQSFYNFSSEDVLLQVHNTLIKVEFKKFKKM